MNVDTGAFRALSDQVDEYRRREAVLALTISSLAGERAEDAPPQSRPRFTVIKGGRL